MNKTYRITHIIPALLLTLFYSIDLYAQNQWDTNGIKVADASAPFIKLQTVSDDSGYVYFTYQDTSTLGDYDIYVQKFDQTGKNIWSSTIINATGDQKYPSIDVDDAGGVYVAWQDEDDNKVKIQHITKEGQPDWVGNGKQICSENSIQQQVKLISDNNGGIFSVWKDKRHDEADIFAQHFDSNGNISWPDTGVAVTTASWIQSDYQLVCTKNGDLIVAWVDERDGNRDIYAQEISSGGNPQWTSDGKAIVTEPSDQNVPCIERCGNKFIITWTDKRYDNGDIYAQLIDENGNLWPSEIPVCDAEHTQSKSKIAESCSSSVIITWMDSRSGGYDIYASRIDSTGTLKWSSVVNNNSTYQYYPEITTDGADGAFITWLDYYNYDFNIYAQHMDKNGQQLWQSTGLSIVTLDTTQNDQLSVSDRNGGFISLWCDKRDGQNDIYAQLTNDNLDITSPSSNDTLNGSSNQNIIWSLRSDEVIFDHLSLQVSETEGDGYPYSIADHVPPDQLSRSWSAPGLNGNEVTIRIQARNAKDSVVCTYYSDSFTMDSEPPLEFSLISPAHNDTVEKIITFEWESTTDNLTGLSHYQLFIDGSLYLDNLQESTYTLTPAQALSTGSHTWTIRAVDKAGVYCEAAANSIEVVYDNTPPDDFHLTVPENNSWTTADNPLFSWESSSDPGRSLKNYTFYLDGSSITTIPPDQTSFSGSILTPGHHTWYVTAVDSANNTTRSLDTWTIKMDNQSPFSFSLLQPDSATWINDTLPQFTWEQTSDTSIGIGLAEYELWIDDVLQIDEISEDTTIQLPLAKSLSEGTHTWYIKAKDSLANSRTSQTTFTLNIDATKPSPFDLTSPESKSFINSLNPDFAWTASEDTLSGLQTYQLWINGELNKDTINELHTEPQAPLPEGRYDWTVIAMDSAGNTQNTETFTFTADTTSPESFLLLYPEDNDTVYTNKPQLIWESAVDNLAGTKKYTLLINEQIAADNLSPSDTIFTITQALDNSTYTWQVITTDSAGNTQNTDIFQFKVSSTPPNITSPHLVQAQEDLQFTYTAEATDPDLQEVEIWFKDSPSWLTPSHNVISGIPREGTQDTTFMVMATDGIYYDSLLVEVQVQPVNDPPEIISSKNASAIEDKQFTYTASAQDPDNEILEYTFEDYATWLTPNNDYICGIPTEGKKDTSFILIASDGELSDTITVSLTVSPVNDPPRITSPDAVTIKEDSLLSYILTAEDPDNKTLYSSFLTKPSWLSISGWTISGYARENYIDTCFTAKVSDGLLSDTITVSVDIEYVNDPPVITSSSTASAVEDSLFTYTSQADDSDSETITFSFSDYPSWLIPDEDSISGTPTEGKIDTSFKVIASDGQLSDTLKVDLTVTPINDAPVIISPDTATATEKELFSYLATAEDVDNQNVSLSFTDYPSWLSVSGNEISGIPGDNCQDTTFLVIAADLKLSDTLKVFLTVNPINDPPRFIQSLPKSIIISSQDTLIHNLDNFVEDPDDLLSSLSWTHTVLDTNTLTITINQKTHIVKINGKNTHGTIHIVFQVADPQGATAKDTLIFTINQTTALDDPAWGNKPEHFSLQDNFPNPFNNSTTIKYGLPRGSTVTLCIYNMLGQKVDELLNQQKQAAGFHQIDWDSGTLPSGIYFYHLQAGSRVAIKKMILMK